MTREEELKLLRDSILSFDKLSSEVKERGKYSMLKKMTKKQLINYVDTLEDYVLKLETRYIESPKNIIDFLKIKRNKLLLRLKWYNLVHKVQHKIGIYA